MTRVNIELPDELHKKLKVICAMEDKTIKELVEEAIEKEVNSGSKVKK